MPISNAFPPRPVFAVALALASSLAGCEREDEPLRPADQTYEVRGKIVELPPPGREQRDVLIHHEAIPAFVDSDGKKVGMKAMVMPFTARDGLSLDGLSRGDKIRFTFEVRWGHDTMLRLTEVEKLNKDTPLGFED